ncbi:GNAT family N-acetyltransferase [Filimonas effusa]|uniref:GNAT family N-acetyltransferase n=1 Tax=Filimonas effusa TaxID=2508721 RepID=A0A4Q1D4Y2_9BACT|nr:GNAT family N-acetyltransferase [Filimonas effusa]RXK83016.1 GNAT family N-acetyltransferase [Filimonas effusa]
MRLSITCRHFKDLAPHEIYAFMRLRSEVFVVEQSCIYLDADNIDQYCYHLLLRDGTEIAAYARLVPPGVSYTETSIGRIVTNPAYRGQGNGKQLINIALEECSRLFGVGPVKIGAQLYLKEFYKAFGFVPVSEVYDEDGIEHIKMLLTPNPSTLF